MNWYDRATTHNLDAHQLTTGQHIHQMHRDIVYDYPSAVEQLGGTSCCAVQAMYQKNRLISVQGHPEFNGDIISEILQRRYDQGIFNEAMYNEAMSRAQTHHDGVKVSAAFLRFLMER